MPEDLPATLAGILTQATGNMNTGLIVIGDCLIFGGILAAALNQEQASLYRAEIVMPKNINHPAGNESVMKRSFGARTIAYPLPVFLVGTYDIHNKPDAMVVAWGGICSSDPPSIAVSVRPSRQTYKNLMEKKEFTVSIPSVDQMSRADAFGIASGADTDKFVRTGFTPVKAEKVDAPYVGECPVVLECRVSQIVVIGSHTQFIGEILDVKIDEKVLDEEGKPVLAKIKPLAFDLIRSEYSGPGNVAGKAFSSGKKYLS